MAGTQAAERSRKVRRVLFAILFANWAVAAAKSVFGLLNDSAAVTGDGLHSFIDGSSNVIGLVAMSFAAQPADEDHPYGHGKFEALASLAIGAMVGIGMLELGRMALASLLSDHHPEVTGGMIAVMVVTLAFNLAITRIERSYGAKLKSPLLLADANHTLSDVFVTLAVLASLFVVKLGYPKADGIVALGVMGVVAYVGYGIVREAAGILSDTARLDPTQVIEVASGVDGVRIAKEPRSRGMEGSVYVDLKIEVDPHLSTEKAHHLAHEVERVLTERFPQVVDVVVHVEPADAEKKKGTGYFSDQGQVPPQPEK